MISIVIPNYNGEKYLKECLQSIKEQKNSDYEIIIIDNASRDSDYMHIKKEVQVFKTLDKNYGFSRAVNEGIKLAKGNYVLLLNNDTVLAPNFLFEIKKAIEEEKYIFAVSSKMISYHNPDLIDDAGDEYTVLGWTIKRGDGKNTKYYTMQGEVFSACAGAALYRKEILEEIGLFDEAFFAYMEDVDISYRARIYGYKNIYCPKACVYHIGSATSGSRHNNFKVRLAARNNIYVPYKNMPFIQLIFNSIFLGIGFVVKGIYFTYKGFGKAYLEGLVEGLTTCRYIKRVPLRVKNFKNYLKIQWYLIKNVRIYIEKIWRA